MALIFAVQAAAIVFLVLDALIRHFERMGTHVVIVGNSVAIFATQSMEGEIPFEGSLIYLITGTVAVLWHPIAISIFRGVALASVQIITIGALQVTESVSSQFAARNI